MSPRTLAPILPDDALAALLAMPLFTGLEPEVRTLLLEKAVFKTFAPDETITEMGTTGQELFVLIAGEVAVTRKGRLITVTPAPDVMGLVSLIDGHTRSATLTAFSDVALFSLPEADLFALMDKSSVLNRNLLVHMADDIRELYDRNDTLMRHFDDFFSSPNARLIPGPYYGDLFDQYFFVMEDAPDRLQALMPRGCSLLPMTGGRYLLTFNFFPGMATRHPSGRGKKFAYAETTPFIPAMVTTHRASPPIRAGLYCPELYPDNYLAIALGRELYGFPKRFALTARSARHIDMVMGGRMVLRASWQEQQAISAEQFCGQVCSLVLGGMPGMSLLGTLQGAFLSLVNREPPLARLPAMPVFVHKEIPDVVSEDETVLEIDELDEIPFRVTAVSDFKVLKGAGVRLLDPEWILGGRCLGAYRLRMSFTFGKGQELIDYARERREAADGQPAGLLHRLMGSIRGR